MKGSGPGIWAIWVGRWGHGFPLWKADPGSNDSIELGDVGYCEAGRFHKVFHLDVQQICDIAVPQEENKPFPSPLKHEVTKDAKDCASMGVYPPFPIGASGTVSVEHTYHEEAALSLKDRRALVSYLPKHQRKILQDYILQHYKTYSISPEDIVVIVGTYKTGDWNAKVTTKWFRTRSVKGGLKGGDLGKSDVKSERDEQESRSPGYNCGHLHLDTVIGAAHGLNDFPACGRNPCNPPAQCIFIHTLRVRRRGKVRRLAMATVTTKTEKVSTSFTWAWLKSKLTRTLSPPPVSPAPSTLNGSAKRSSDCEDPTLEVVVVSDEDVIQLFGRSDVLESNAVGNSSMAANAPVSTEGNWFSSVGIPLSLPSMHNNTPQEALYDAVAKRKFEVRSSLRWYRCANANGVPLGEPDCRSSNRQRPGRHRLLLAVAECDDSLTRQQELARSFGHLGPRTGKRALGVHTADRVVRSRATAAYLYNFPLFPVLPNVLQFLLYLLCASFSALMLLIASSEVEDNDPPSRSLLIQSIELLILPFACNSTSSHDCRSLTPPRNKFAALDSQVLHTR
ncbi:hypothetical protein GGX14DRAFT_635814 [Mycena pura]|uniref:Uncharacterized protein n=1 Tax=Mycena pura TaxID=153505 RepID=A0AAD6YFE0_9AGAR|nr:hypothetical protein GGX14DRAFT_635814 [Mycena pura]